MCGELKFCAPHAQYGFAMKRGKLVKTKCNKKAKATEKSKRFVTRTGVKFLDIRQYQEVEQSAMYAFQAIVQIINALGLTQDDIQLQDGGEDE